MDVRVSKTPNKDLGLHSAANHPGDDGLPKTFVLVSRLAKGGPERGKI